MVSLVSTSWAGLRMDFVGLVEIMGGFVRGFLGKKDEGMQERRE